MKTTFTSPHLILFAAIGLSACHSSKSDQKGQAPGQGQPQTVNVYVARTEPLTQTIESAGTLLPEEEVQLAPEVSGRVIRLNFKEGQYVAKGQLLVKLVDSDLRAQHDKLSAQLELANITEGRQKSLLDVQGISRQDYDLTRNQVSGIRADLSVVDAMLAKTEIRAPFAGKIGLKNISEGAYITAGTVITSLQKANTLKLDFAVPERYEALIKPGANVTFSIDGRQGKFTANVYAIEPRISLNTRSLQVRARYNNTNQLLPGAFANVTVGLAENNNAVLVPTEGIIPEARNKKVIKVVNGVAKFELVETGERDANRVAITKGVEAGDTIIVTGLMQLKPDSPVKIGKVVTESAMPKASRQ